MHVRAILIAVSLLASASAFAAPNDTAKAPMTPHASTQPVATHHATKKFHKHHTRHHAKHHAGHHKAHHVASNTRHMGGAAAGPVTNLGDRTRQARIDEALAKYRRTHG